MADDRVRGYATAFVDDRFRVDKHNLLLEQRRQERWQLAQHKGQLQSHERNREIADLRYVQRLKSIEERRDRIADRLHRQHNSIGGRLQAMTRKGRARQAEQLERLDERAAQLQGRAHRQYQALTERQAEARQRDRIFCARDIKLFRQDNLDARRSHADHHERTRDIKIEVREQQLKQAQQQERQEALRHALRQQEREQGRSRSR